MQLINFQNVVAPRSPCSCRWIDLRQVTIHVLALTCKGQLLGPQKGAQGPQLFTSGTYCPCVPFRLIVNDHLRVEQPCLHTGHSGKTLQISTDGFNKRLVRIDTLENPSLEITFLQHQILTLDINQLMKTRPV